MTETTTPIADYPWRKLLDTLDEALIESGALADPKVFHFRRELGRALGCVIESEACGYRVDVTARTFPIYSADGRITVAPLARPADDPR